jgi:hypothetical protein
METANVGRQEFGDNWRAIVPVVAKNKYKIFMSITDPDIPNWRHAESERHKLEQSLDRKIQKVAPGGFETLFGRRPGPATLNFSHEILSLFQHEKVDRPSIFLNSKPPSTCCNIGKIARENPKAGSRVDITELIPI